MCFQVRERREYTHGITSYDIHMYTCFHDDQRHISMGIADLYNVVSLLLTLACLAHKHFVDFLSLCYHFSLIGTILTSGLDLIRLVLISADGCTFFIGNNKKGHTLLETLLQFARYVHVQQVTLCVCEILLVARH